MATDKAFEHVVATMFPKAFRHLQQLIMDAEKCSKTYGKKSLFGADKFESSMEKFNKTLANCAIALVEDRVISDPRDSLSALKAIDAAMQVLGTTYSSWPLAFQFWDDFYSFSQSQSPAIIDENVIVPCPTCGQKLRHPTGKKLKITCPSCGRIFYT